MMRKYKSLLTNHLKECEKRFTYLKKLSFTVSNIANKKYETVEIKSKETQKCKVLDY